MKLVKVELKTGKTIEVLPQEVEILKEAGMLKESKVPNVTIEEKDVGKTKQDKKIQRRSANWYPGPGETEEPPPRPANIDSKSFKTGKK